VIKFSCLLHAQSQPEIFGEPRANYGGAKIFVDSDDNLCYL